MFRRIATVFEMINSPKIAGSTLLSGFQRIDAIDVTHLGKS